MAALWEAAVRRQFLLKLKLKYAGIHVVCTFSLGQDGHKIAQKLSKQISKETKSQDPT